ncbi:DUF5682 family protein [Hydrogenophaga sp.]|uniref:DUF5682 family protein n=1 Tax=Hydrogenophaga sp. TaxID=1904254 RepID=UPI0027191A09|nr:DUF5682 family protein [Hydrogenophaga sp.]MDO9436657.1 DUF5682 family protein [Hydrogenophaga sp.]
MGSVRVIGVRHHSPACARLVAHAIEHERPQAVLIEGPSDFNPRIGELLLDHRLPLALYSYANEDQQPAQCWFPLLDYSPEWVALRAGHAAGAALHFIDLPHWRYRTVPDTLRGAGLAQGRSRYADITAQLCHRFQCDSDDALWDHLFESLPDDASAPQDLAARLDLYFAELRGDEPGTEQDQARERYMAQWVAWAAAYHERVLVVCGGWHKPALDRVPLNAAATQPAIFQPADDRAAGSYLVPYEYRQVDALGGYAAGMPSPMFYQWVWQHGLRGAGEHAMASVVSRLRRSQVALSTADLMAFEQTRTALSRLRGHASPTRIDLLDALQSAAVKEALPTPAPWSESGGLHAQHHPVLREALLALTGEGAGRLHSATPLPPLLHDVRDRLAACDLPITRQPRHLVLDRRRAEDTPRAHTLWQLLCLNVGGIALAETRAPHAPRGLAPALMFEEHWQLQQNERWFPDLIEASVHGAMLESAARQCLLRRVAAAGGHPGFLTQCLVQAIRAGLLDMGQALAEQVQSGLAQAHDHGALADAAQSLATLVHTGFWGDDPRALVEGTLVLLADRLLRLLDGRDGVGSAAQIEADVRAAAVFDTLLRLDLPAFDGAFAQQTLARFARAASKPPALRGAALGVVCQQRALAGEGERAHEDVLALVREMPPRDALGDFLYGLFSCARAMASESDGIVRAVHAAIAHMGTEDFLAALPSLRGAFAWFPPRERGALAAHAAQLLGLAASEQHRLLNLRGGTEALLDARRLEAQALSWAQAFGVLP